MKLVHKLITAILCKHVMEAVNGLKMYEVHCTYKAGNVYDMKYKRETSPLCITYNIGVCYFIQVCGYPQLKNKTGTTHVQ